MYTWDSVHEYHFDFHQARILKGINDSLVWKTPKHELRLFLLVTPCQVTIKTVILQILQRQQQKYASNRTPRKTVQAIVDFSINTPTVQVTISNAVILPDLIQMLLTMPTQPPWNKDHSNPSTLWNLSWSRFFIQ